MVPVHLADLSLPHHAQAVVELLNSYALDAMGGGRPLSDFVRHNLIGELQKRSDAVVLLAFVDTVPAGLAICFEGFSTFECKPLLNIHDLVVALPYRGRGISKALLAKAQAVAQNLGCCKLTLEVLEGNRVAQAAYRSCGFDGYALSPETGKALFWQKKLL